MRALPNLTVLAPGDPVEAREATRALIAHHGPAYLRLGRAGEPMVHVSPIDFQIGKSIPVRSGMDATLVATGGQLYDTVRAADVLVERGIHARVISMHTLKPLDVDALICAATETSAVFTVEEHSPVGGLGGAVAEALLEADVRPRRFRRIALNDAFSSIIGDQEFIRAAHGLDVAGIVATVQSVLEPTLRTAV